jgi:hypothetical protein
MDGKDMTPFDRAVRGLRFCERRRRFISTICILWGLTVVALSLWVQHRSDQAIGKLIESFYDAPVVAMPMMSAITTTISNSRVHFLIGVVFIGYGLVRFFVPNFKTIALLGILDHLNLGRAETEGNNA